MIALSVARSSPTDTRRRAVAMLAAGILAVVISGSLNGDALGQVVRPTTTKPTRRSNIEGQWWISMHDYFHAHSDDLKVPDKLEKASLLVATVRADGTFDWGRTFVGVDRGWNGLEYPDDECTNSIDGFARFKVLESQYTADASRIRIQRCGEAPPGWCNFTPAQLAETVWSIEARRHGKNELIFSYASPSVPTISMKLVRRGVRSPETRQSAIAGAWATEVGGLIGRAIVIRIRPDGVFDWTGNSEGRFYGWYELERKGDKCSRWIPFGNLVGTSEVLSSEYERDRSFVRIRIRSDERDSEEEYAIEAKRAGENRIRFEVRAIYTMADKTTTAERVMTLVPAVGEKVRIGLSSFLQKRR